MRRRILTTTLAITVAALIAFGVPLGWAVGHIYRSQQFSRLSQSAAVALAAVPAEGLHGADPVEVPAVPAGVRLAYYDVSGRLVAGLGPTAPDRGVRQAMSGRLWQGQQGPALEVAQPITANETTIGVVEATSVTSAVVSRTLRTWAAMAVLGLMVVGLAALVALWQTRRLSRPVDDLVDAAGRLGDGDFALQTSPSGVAEIDRAGQALEFTSTRLGELMERERAFTAHASHQLRTPLTALRLSLENAIETPGIDLRRAAVEAVTEVDRLQDTLEQLLVLSRTGGQPGRCRPLDDILNAVEQRWHPVLAERGRRLHMVGSVFAEQVPSALAQIIDVLVDNATTHGRGTVEVRAAAPSPNGVSVEVSDEGEGMSRLPGSAAPTTTDGHGLGLRLARSLAEADGGRLVLKRAGSHPIVAVVVPLVTSDR